MQTSRSRYDKPPLAAECCHLANDLEILQATDWQTKKQTNRWIASLRKAPEFASGGLKTDVQPALRVVSIIRQWFRNETHVTHRTAPQFRRQAAGTCKKIQHGSNCLWNAGGTLLAAASSCVTDFSRHIYRTETLAVRCGALRFYDILTYEWWKHALVYDTGTETKINNDNKRL